MEIVFSTTPGSFGITGKRKTQNRTREPNPVPVTFVEGDASAYAFEPDAFDIVSCIGVTWIGGGLAGTLDKLKPALRDRESMQEEAAL